MKKIVTILGARPQFIKGAVLSRIISEKNEFEEIIIHTGQHFDKNMSNIFFEEMHIPKPKYNLDINGLSHGAMTGRMIESIEKILLDEKPEIVVVFGDTNSTLAGALAAKKIGIKVAHIEAGLRSFNMSMPEEVNRILTDRISNLLSCPTQKAIDNLREEGFVNFDIEIYKHGDIMKDAMEFYKKKSKDYSNVLEKLSIKGSKFVLATIHRQENTESATVLSEIFEALGTINKKQPVVLPLHPRTAGRLKEYKIETDVVVIEPQGYYDMIQLLENCTMVITDSGGLQKEAFFNKKQCIVVREETEWVELVEKGYAKIVGANKKNILNTFKEFLNSNVKYDEGLYGKNVGEQIYLSIKKIINK
ncbi:non-hydrolyzing UDP-N-acetylglucosamine 2-epimerase [Tenacibaculum xiamenense]|uniref:non-hydrolyzing UDP-N-acetylglucosamine 2-epimerase n=1 Tax=Tenacibaculum xiamenense TaxID=1261553 RepID=UPI00389517DA